MRAKMSLLNSILTQNNTVIEKIINKTNLKSNRERQQKNMILTQNTQII